MYKFLYKYTKLVVATVAIVIALNLNTGLPVFTKLKISYPLTSNIVAADQGNALPYDPGVSIYVSRTVQHQNGHYAIDFATQGRTGINARASRNGTVIRNEWFGGDDFGWCVYIRYDNNHLGIYAHLAQQSPLGVSQPVRQGDVIGEIGTTGNSTGIHLHYERHASPVFDRSKYYIPTFREYPNTTVAGGGFYTSQNAGQLATLESAIKGRVSVHRGGNSHLYVSWDNNQGQWQHPPAEITGPYGPSQTAHSPVAVYDKYGKLNVFHVGMNGQVYQQILEGNEWRTINTGLVTGAQPEVVLHEGYLNIYARGGQSQLLHVSSGDNRSWGQVRSLPTNYPVYGKPSAAVRGREIMVAYPTIGNQIATHYSATGQGYTNRLVPGLRTRREIGLVSYNGRFVMVHVGDNLKGYLNFTENAVGWSNTRQIPYSTFTIGIDMSVSNNLIHLSHGGGDGQIYYQSSNTHEGTNWSSPQRQHYTHSSPNPVTLTGK